MNQWLRPSVFNSRAANRESSRRNSTSPTEDGMASHEQHRRRKSNSAKTTRINGGNQLQTNQWYPTACASLRPQPPRLKLSGLGRLVTAEFNRTLKVPCNLVLPKKKRNSQRGRTSPRIPALRSDEKGDRNIYHYRREERRSEGSFLVVKRETEEIGRAHV